MALKIITASRSRFEEGVGWESGNRVVCCKFWNVIGQKEL